MIRKLTGAIFVTGMLLLGAVVVQLARAADANAGKGVYDRKCKTCHGADGEGNPGMAKALNVQIPPLGSEGVQAKSDADIKKVVTEGKGKMRPVQGLSSDDVDNVIAFIRTLKKK